MLFVCPKCKKILSQFSDGRAVCEGGHSYDRAKEGYYNLLLKNTGGVHGDNKEMVTARRTFLDTGAYLPLVDKLSEIASSFVKDGNRVLDAGCGEGYYTDLIEKRLTEGGVNALVSGFDISRDAVKFAAKKNKRLSLAVASSYDMPVSDGSVDFLINVFSPLALSETVRVLKRGGKMVMAIPDEKHLFGLKEVLYENPYKNTVDDSSLSGLKLIAEDKISYKLSLNSREEISSLFMMTPYAYRTPREARERLLSLSSLQTDIQFIVFTYEKEQ